MKNLILEIKQVPLKIIEEKVEKDGSKIIRAEVQFQKADTINHNKRFYPRSILEREIKKLKVKCKAGEVTGCAYHPQNEAEVPDVSHVWEDVWMEKDGTCAGIVKILPTSVGKDVQVVAKNAKIGLSSRGYGTLIKKEIEFQGAKADYDEVGEDFTLVSPGDFVLSPSVEGAGIRQFVEKKIDVELEKNINEIYERELRPLYEEAKFSGYHGTFEDFKNNVFRRI